MSDDLPDLRSARTRLLLTALANFEWLVHHRGGRLDVEHGMVLCGEEWAVPVASLTEPRITPGT